jgi:pimeloyl-ACP methyl ester carboxylesterase
MTPAYVVQIATPKKYALNGLWFGPKKPKQVVIWIHGLGSSMFGKVNLFLPVVDKDTAVLAFNNRGTERIVQIKRTSDTKSKRLLGGAAHERFTDSADDIQGAIDFAHRQGVKRIFLTGHSTGCQKSIYWAAKGGRGVKGIVLLAPVSDYAGVVAKYGKARVFKALAYANSLMKKGKSDELIPSSIWPEELNDAQRLISLYSPDSVEEIFPYAQTKKPKLLQGVRIPILALWAEHDEFSDRPAKQIKQWFDRHLKQEDSFVVIPKVTHGFKGGEKMVAKVIGAFMKEC